MRLRMCAENQALIQHMNGLACQIEQYNADNQPPQAITQHAERQPGQHQQQQTDAARHLRQAAVRQVPCSYRRQRPHRAHQAKGTNHRMRKVERCLTQRQHQCTPEDAECRKHQQRQHAANLQRTIAQQQRQHRTQQGGVAKR
ncbi:hypothetical protein D3C71_1247310 [compost metagenome]